MRMRAKIFTGHITHAKHIGYQLTTAIGTFAMKKKNNFFVFCTSLNGEEYKHWRRVMHVCCRPPPEFFATYNETPHC